MKEMNLDNCLKGIRGYIPNGSKDEFLIQLGRIPDVQDVFKRLVEENPMWINLAMRTEPEFLLEKFGTNKKTKPNELKLCIFDNGTQPVIKVEIFG